MSQETVSYYIGELIEDAYDDPKSFVECEKQPDKQSGYIHRFDQWVEECGAVILKCIYCNKIYEFD